MSTTFPNWYTKQPPGASHVIDDGGMIYWSVTPDLTNEQVAEAFAASYDGTLGDYDVTDLRTNKRADFTAP